ncbi:protein of unknown function [Enterobacter cancerogenus]|nr:protein of unknown function [Enterobacter cancerogenus]
MSFSVMYDGALIARALTGRLVFPRSL